MSDENDGKSDAMALLQGAIDTHPKGRDTRPSFHALWHLKALNVVDNLTEFASTAWDEAETTAKTKAPVIVVMDTPLDYEHPNLEGVIERALMCDFSVFSDGAFPVATEQLGGNLDSERGRRQAVIAKLADHQNPPAMPIESDRKSQLTRHVPGAHGTAVSGLIAARPDFVGYQTPAYLGDEGEDSELNFAILSYAGINPFARIVPVTLSAAPYPDMVNGALDYIKAIDPDIIVIAAAWAEGADLNRPIATNEEGAVLQLGAAEADADAWKDVSDKLIALSKDTIVLCAAGNENTSELAYPASLHKDDRGEIYAITACDVNGEPLSYSPRPETHARVLATLSSPLPNDDQVSTVLDRFRYVLPELRKTHVSMDMVATVDPRDIISLDPTGSQGYNPSPYPGQVSDHGTYLEIGSLFTRFSGTSAATAIAAGLASLALMHEGGSAGNETEPSSWLDLGQAQSLWASRVIKEGI
ncbi:MAG: S8 family serine peptidase [Pseudoruegeria sp.]